MITLISLHNHTFSTKIAITVNQKVNCSLTRDMVTIYITSHVLTLVDILHVKKNKKKQENCSLNKSVLLFFGKNSFETSCGRNTKWVFDISRSTIL